MRFHMHLRTPRLFHLFKPLLVSLYPGQQYRQALGDSFMNQRLAFGGFASKRL